MYSKLLRNMKFVQLSKCMYCLVHTIIILYRITDAFNNTRDRVRYLEALSPHLETLFSSSSPLTVVTTTLPSLATTMKQMEGLSRSYARSGYLGILFIKVL